MADEEEVKSSPPSTVPPDLLHSEFVHISQEHDAYLCRKLYKQWQDLQYCDLTLAVKDGELRAHSCIVAAFSPKLKSILENSHISSRVGGIHLHLLLEVGVLQCLLNMMYTGVLSFNTAMLSSVLSTARWLEMEEVVRLCQDYREATGCQEDEATMTDELVLCEVTHDDSHLMEASDGNESLVDTLTDPDSDKKCGRRSLAKMSRKRACPSKVVTSPRSSSRVKSRSVQDKMSILLDVLQIKQEKEDAGEGGGLLQDCSALQGFSLEEVNQSVADTAKLVLDMVEMNGTGEALSAMAAARRRGLKRKGFGSGLRKRGRKPSSGTGTDSLAKKKKLQRKSELDNQEEDFALGKIDTLSCKKCMAKFGKLDDYRQHVDNHPTFSCDVCSTKYFRKSNLTRHMRTAHSSQHHLMCRLCSFVAQTETGLLAHSKQVHQDSKPFRCEHPGCTYGTWKYDFLHRHSEIHSEVKQYVCDKCGQGFAQHAGLMSHRRACYQMQEFLCDICGQSFNHVQSMRAHRRTIHFGEKPYSCKMCGSPFSDQRNLKRHMRIHENLFPYQCEICKQKYRHSNSLKAHMKKHMKDSDYPLSMLGSSSTDPPEKKNHDVMRALTGEMINTNIQQPASYLYPDMHPRVWMQDGYSTYLDRVREAAGFPSHDSQVGPFCLSTKGFYPSGGHGDAVFPGQILTSPDSRSRSLQGISDHRVGHSPHHLSPINSSTSSPHTSAFMKQSPGHDKRSEDTSYGFSLSGSLQNMRHETPGGSGAVSPFAMGRKSLTPESGNSYSHPLPLVTSPTPSVSGESPRGRDLRTSYSQLQGSENGSMRSEPPRSSVTTSPGNTNMHSLSGTPYNSEPMNRQTSDARDELGSRRSGSANDCDREGNSSRGGGGSSSSGSGGNVDSGGGSRGRSSYGLETLAEICFSSSL